MAVSSKKRFSIALYQGVSCFGKKCASEKTTIFNFTQNGTSQPIVSNSSNALDWKRKIIYRFKISAKAGIQGSRWKPGPSLWDGSRLSSGRRLDAGSSPAWRKKCIYKRTLNIDQKEWLPWVYLNRLWTIADGRPPEEPQDVVFFSLRITTA